MLLTFLWIHRAVNYFWPVECMELPFGYYLSRRLVIVPEIFFAGVKVCIVSLDFLFFLNEKKNRKGKKPKIYTLA